MSYSKLTIVLAFLFAPACASSTLSQQQLMDTQGAITSAEELKAAENPDAKLHLQYATEQLDAAKRMMDEGDKPEARRMLDRASADADLALTLARTAKVHKESQRARAEVEQLRSGKASSTETAGIGE